MNQKLTFNFAVLRFMPYPETEEFVNVGIILACPQTGTISFKMESRRRDRVTNFFPEMDASLFTEGRHILLQEMKRLTHGLSHDAQSSQIHFQFKEKEFIQLFREVVKPRESLFRFSGIGTIMLAGEQQALEQLFNFYVERQFAKQEEYHETVMRRRLAAIFKAKEILSNYHEKAFGNEQYHVNIPFVHEENNLALKAIKPLDLDKNDTTRIIEYGDKWRMRVERLKAINDFPREMLFVVRQADSGKRLSTALEIRSELSKLGAITVAEREEDKVLAFAQNI